MRYIDQVRMWRRLWRKHPRWVIGGFVVAGILGYLMWDVPLLAGVLHDSVRISAAGALRKHNLRRQRCNFAGQ